MKRSGRGEDRKSLTKLMVNTSHLIGNKVVVICEESWPNKRSGDNFQQHNAEYCPKNISTPYRKSLANSRQGIWIVEVTALSSSALYIIANSHPGRVVLICNLYKSTHYSLVVRLPPGRCRRVCVLFVQELLGRMGFPHSEIVQWQHTLVERIHKRQTPQSALTGVINER